MRARARAVVVGGGGGGLAVGGRLARAGLDVRVLEKNAGVGGRAQSRVESSGLGDFRFDTGPSLLLMREKYEEAFAALGTGLPTELLRVDPAYRVFHADGTQLDLTSDVREMTLQLDEVEPGAGLAFVEWLSKAKAMFDIGGEFIETDAHTLFDLAKVDTAAALLSRVPPWELVLSHDFTLRSYFKDSRLRSLFTFQDLYVGLCPFDSPGVFSLLAGTELADGVWYPKGGFGAVRDGLRQAAHKNGAEVTTNAMVRRVVVEQGRAVGVELESDGEFIPADVVVANPDVPYTYDELLVGPAAAKTARTLGEKKYSAGVVSFNWCVEGRLSRILHHSVFLSNDPKQAWDRATAAENLAVDGRCPRPNFYVHAPARSDPSCCPPGCDSVMVLLPVGNAQDVAGDGEKAGSVNWEALVDSGREAVLRRFDEVGVRVQRPDGGESSVREAIASEFVYTPADWERLYNLKYGAAFGLAHGLDQISYFRPDNGPRGDGHPEGLYFVGASTRPGNGVPLVLMGAKITSERILGDLRLGSS